MFPHETFHGNATEKLLFDIMNEKLFSFVNIKILTGVCTDGANVATGKYVIGQLKQRGISVHTFHCIIHIFQFFNKPLLYEIFRENNK